MVYQDAYRPIFNADPDPSRGCLTANLPPYENGLHPPRNPLKSLVPKIDPFTGRGQE